MIMTSVHPPPRRRSESAVHWDVPPVRHNGHLIPLEIAATRANGVNINLRKENGCRKINRPTFIVTNFVDFISQ